MFSLNLMQNYLLCQGLTLTSALKKTPSSSRFCGLWDQPYVEPPAHFQGSMWGAEPALQNSQAGMAGNPENVTCLL